MTTASRRTALSAVTLTVVLGAGAGCRCASVEDAPDGAARSGAEGEGRDPAPRARPTPGPRDFGHDHGPGDGHGHGGGPAEGASRARDPGRGGAEPVEHGEPSAEELEARRRAVEEATRSFGQALSAVADEQGGSPCERSYATLVALSRASDGAPPDEGAFRELCLALPETMQHCLSPAYQLANREECFEARDELDDATMQRLRDVMMRGRPGESGSHRPHGGHRH